MNNRINRLIKAKNDRLSKRLSNLPNILYITFGRNGNNKYFFDLDFMNDIYYRSPEYNSYTELQKAIRKYSNSYTERGE